MKRRSRWKWYLLGCAAIGLTAVAAAWAWIHSASGILVVIRNDGHETLRDIVVHVTGRAYFLGDLAAGTTASVRVRPRSESHVEIEYTNGSGTRKRLNAGGYFEPGYQGTIFISTDGEKILESQHDVAILY